MGEHAQAGGGLAAGALEFVVEDGIFEAGEVEGGGVAHKANADVVCKTVAEEAFGESGGAHEEVAGDGEGEFSGDQGPEAVRNAGFRRCGHDYEVDDEFGDPEHPQWHQSPDQAADEGGEGEERAGFPDHAEERREISECLETIAPGSWGVGLGDVGIQLEPPAAGYGAKWPVAGDGPMAGFGLEEIIAEV